MKTLAIQVVLYNQRSGELEKLFQCLAGLWTPDAYRLELRTGDCGDSTELGEPFVTSWRPELEAAGIAWVHTDFGENLGFGRGHNQLFAAGPSDRVWLLNPDAFFARDILVRLSRFADERADWGIVEPRSLPIEHAKAVDFETFETGWCSGFAPLISTSAFEEIGGFDEGFFLYEEDVDLSWRIKSTGRKLYCCPWASVYHAHVGGVSDWQRHWSQVSELRLLRKYRRNGHLLCRLSDLASSEDFVCLLSEVGNGAVASAHEKKSASWSGRMSSALRWGPYSIGEGEGPESDRISVWAREEDPDALVETALSAWAVGAEQVSVDAPPEVVEKVAERLPFSLTDAGGTEVAEGHVLIHRRLEHHIWAELYAKRCERGLLTLWVDGKNLERAASVWRMPTSGGLILIQDPEGWRFWVRQLRARLRVFRLDSGRREAIQRFLNFEPPRQ